MLFLITTGIAREIFYPLSEYENVVTCEKIKPTDSVFEIY